MAVKTYGSIRYIKGKAQWVIDRAEPHICIKLKAIFSKIQKTQTVPFEFVDSPENCHELLWFMKRYPLGISDADAKVLSRGSKVFVTDLNERESILLPDYIPASVYLNEPHMARDYQLRARDLFLKVKRMFLGDDMGLGKTLTAIISILGAETRPASVVAQAHLPIQWKREIEKFTSLTVHIIKTRKAYSLPVADVYIFKYSSLSGWIDLFGSGFFKTAIFDEMQELRHTDTDKYQASKALATHAQHCLGMSGTPIYNFGIEMFSLINLIRPGSLGLRHEFVREWCNDSNRVDDPKALGTYLRENSIMLRRTREEVGRELPPINKLVYTVDYDEDEVQKVEDLAYKLALSTTVGSFMERGHAARELDLRVRHATGVSKARGVSSWVKLFLENGEPVVLAGWHRDVYEIWQKELKDYKPVMFTGSESPTQKEESKRKFVNGETNLFIISLRSGVGLDGLQERCKTVIFGELDWSPKVHDQVVTRVDRDGQQAQVTAIYLLSEWGSDPVIVDLLGIKASQSSGMMDPLVAVTEQYSDESRIKLLANQFLNSNKRKPDEIHSEVLAGGEGDN